MVTTAFVIGRLITSSWIAGRIPPGRQAESLVLAGLLMGSGLAGAGLSHSLIGAMVGFAVAGAANSLQVSAISVLISTHVPAEVKGCAFGAMGSFNNAATVLGTILGAPAVAAAGPAGALILAGAGTFAATALAAPVLLRRKRELADTTRSRGEVDLEKTAAPGARPSPIRQDSHMDQKISRQGADLLATDIESALGFEVHIDEAIPERLLRQPFPPAWWIELTVPALRWPRCAGPRAAGMSRSVAAPETVGPMLSRSLPMVGG